MKVMNYVYAAGVYILINAALYGSEYSGAVSLHGRSIRESKTFGSGGY